MINHVWSVLCSSTIIDRESNLVSLINVLEELTIDDIPQPDGVLPIGFDITSLWTRANTSEPCRGNSRISLINPEGEVKNQIESKIDLTKHERLRSRGHFQGLHASKSGMNIFQVELQEEGKDDWEVVARIPLKIVFRKIEKESAKRFSG